MKVLAAILPLLVVVTGMASFEASFEELPEIDVSTINGTYERSFAPSVEPLFREGDDSRAEFSPAVTCPPTCCPSKYPRYCSLSKRCCPRNSPACCKKECCKHKSDFCSKGRCYRYT